MIDALLLPFLSASFETAIIEPPRDIVPVLAACPADADAPCTTADLHNLCELKSHALGLAKDCRSGNLRGIAANAPLRETPYGNDFFDEMVDIDATSTTPLKPGDLPLALRVMVKATPCGNVGLVAFGGYTADGALTLFTERGRMTFTDPDFAMGATIAYRIDPQTETIKSRYLTPNYALQNFNLSFDAAGETSLRLGDNCFEALSDDHHALTPKRLGCAPTADGLLEAEHGDQKIVRAAVPNAGSYPAISKRTKRTADGEEIIFNTHIPCT